jgi:hypothetical protein
MKFLSIFDFIISNQRAQHIFLCILVCCIAAPAIARPPQYGDGTATQDKIQYCNMLVQRYGHRSQAINSQYYGVGVSRPVSGQWETRIKSPSWFSGDLFIVFEQITEGRYRDFKHTAVCKWDDQGMFDFMISHFEYGNVPICYLYGGPEYECP